MVSRALLPAVLLLQLRLAETLLLGTGRRAIPVSIGQKLREAEQAFKGHLEDYMPSNFHERSVDETDDGSANICIAGHLVPELYVMGSSAAAVRDFTRRFETSPSVAFDQTTSKATDFVRSPVDHEMWAALYPRCNRNVRKVVVESSLLNFDVQAPNVMYDFYHSNQLAWSVRFVIILREPAKELSEVFHRQQGTPCNRAETERPASLQDAVQQLLQGSCTCGCLTVQRVSYAAKLQSYFERFSPQRFFIAPIDDIVYEWEPLATDMWKVLQMPPGTIAANQLLRTAKLAATNHTSRLEDDLDAELLLQFRRALETYGGASALSKVLAGSGANLHKYEGDPYDECEIRGWIQRAWDSVTGRADPCNSGLADNTAAEAVGQNATEDDTATNVADQDEETEVTPAGGNNLCINTTLVPEFFLLGAPKSSTTTFVEAFGSSQGIVFYTPGKNEEDWKAKEPWVFATDGPPDASDWLSHYPECHENLRQVALDCTPGYLGHPESAHWIYKMYSQDHLAGRIMFMVLLREPIKRMQSHFYHHQSRQECGDKLPKSFQDSVTNFLDMGKTCDCDCEDATHSLYAEAFDRYFEFFSPSQFTVVPFLDGITDNLKLATLVWKRLGLPGGSGVLKDDSVVGHIGQNHHDYPELEDDVDPSDLEDLHAEFRQRTGPMKIAEKLVGTSAYLYMYSGSNSDQCGIARWLAHGWGESSDKHPPCEMVF